MLNNASNKPALLYISPVVPAATGGGIAMRAGSTLEALCFHYRVTVVVIPLHATLEREIPAFLRNLCESVAVVSRDAATPDQIENAAGPGQRFDVVHVFRLAAMELVHAYLRQMRGGVRLHLDLDDIESKTNRRIAELHRTAGQDAMAARTLEMAQRASLMESVAFRLFHRVYVCSEADRRELAPRCPAELRVLPNVVRLPPTVKSVAASDIFRFLFVGTLGYYPNQDGVRFFCSSILPRVRREASMPFVVNLVGNGDAAALRSLSAHEIHLIGPVADVHTWYENCDAVIVPMRAGGGTRIKILEAFSYMRPVVSTSLGLEGIEARPGWHLLVADTPDEFATACLQLMSDPDLRCALATRARDLISDSYTIEAVENAISSNGAS